MNKLYKEPEFNVVITKAQDVLTVSAGGDHFNMLGDKVNTTYYRNENWLEI